MSYKVSPGNIFGRIGSGVGQGLAEQVPKEMERGRLAEGLRRFSNESSGLTPLQNFARLAAIPGITPQMVQTFGELAKLQSRGEALKGEALPKQKTAQALTDLAAQPKIEPKQAATLESPEALEATINPYKPKTLQDLQRRAGELLRENPTLYNQDPQLALQAASQEEQQNQAIQASEEAARTKQLATQDRLKSSLRERYSKLTGPASIPENVYNKIENDAINALKPKSLGGNGLTEQQVIDQYGKNLQDISREYAQLNNIGSAVLLSRTPSEKKAQINSLRQKFKERNDLENFSDSLVASTGISPSKAYYLSYPVKEQKELNNAIVKLPRLNPGITYEKAYPEVKNPKYLDPEYIDIKTLEAAHKIAPLLGKEASILSVSEELKDRGYNPNIWIDYILNNRDKLQLTERQGRELDKPRPALPTLDDAWFFYTSGLEPLKEMK